MYLVTLSKQASKDKQLIKNAGLTEKAKGLLDILTVDPLKNPLPYEKLLGNLSGWYSRRINLQHRLVYRIEENDGGLTDADGKPYNGIVYVRRMWTHHE